jgi:hypothetical protein
MTEEVAKKSHAIAAYKIRSAEEAREKGKKGGIASGESRRRAAELRKLLTALLESNANTYGELPENLLFQKSAEHSIQGFIMCSLTYKAMRGDISAINSIIKMLGVKAP